MATSRVELVRSLHEDIEIFEKAAAEELAARAAMKHRPDQIMSDHTTHALLGQILARNAQLDALYTDEDGSLREDVDEMTGDRAIDAFYARLGRVREAHAALEPVPVAADAEEQMLAAVLEAEPQVTFTGEEGEGRFLDLHGCHDAYVNLRGIKPVVAAAGKAGKAAKTPAAVKYYTYITEHALRPERTALSVARGAAYARYAQQLLETLVDFVHRTQPLTDVHALLADAEAELSRQWDAGHVLRWQRVEGGAPAVADGAPAADGVAADGEAGGEAGAGAPDAHIDLSALRSAGELEAALGAERLKRELGMRGLKCGGRPAERAQRLFLALTAPEQLDRKQYAHAAVAQPAAAHGGASNGNGACVHDGVGVSAAAAASAAASAHARRCASIEAAIVRLGEVLGQTPAETAANVEKNAARTFDEIAADLAAAEAADAEDAGARDTDGDDDDDVTPIYNPKNLPLGWDGKPIPYWLYKLHGLNLEFKCEICGGQSYWGPREFERHFQEARHAHSMRCLGISNEKAYHGITLIDDAYAMQRQLAEAQRQSRFVPEADEECEDSLGNVMPRKTYDDLARQGLL